MRLGSMATWAIDPSLCTLDLQGQMVARSPPSPYVRIYICIYMYICIRSVEGGPFGGVKAMGGGFDGLVLASVAHAPSVSLMIFIETG